MALWAAEEIDEDLQDVDLSLAIGNYGQNGMYDDGVCHFAIFCPFQ
jgi:translation initiation factor 3 subunit L